MPSLNRRSIQQLTALIRIQQCDTTVLPTPDRDYKSFELQHDRYEYHVAQEIQHLVPPSPPICFDVYTYNDGNRRFVIDKSLGPKGYVALAYQVGEALIAWERDLDREQRHEYQVAKLLYDRSDRVQEKITRRVKSFADLTVSRTAPSSDENSILPAMLRANESQPSSWSLREFKKAGRQAAHEAGLKRPSEGKIISYGLFDAARNNPLIASKQQVRALMLMGLFDVSRSEDRPSKQIVNEVWRRFKLLLADHLEDSLKMYLAWVGGGKSNLPKAIANLAKRPLGKLPLDETNHALLDLTWQSHLRVAKCLGRFADSFSQSLPKPLSRAERMVFRSMYCPQWYFGGLLLPMIMDRSDILKPMIGSLLTDPTDKDVIRAFHRVLVYYSEMVARRREADRRNRQGGNRLHLTIEPGTAQSDRSLNNQPSPLLEDVLERKGAVCDTCGGRLIGEADVDAIKKDCGLMIETYCLTHGRQADVLAEWSELKHAANQD